jgi:transcriptional regulator with XRE-family HTH domain
MPEPIDAYAERLGKRLVRARGRRSQQWLADQIGVRQGTVSNWELGRVAPSRRNMDRLEHALGLPRGELWATLAAGGQSINNGQSDERTQQLKTVLGMVEQAHAEMNTARRELNNAVKRLDEIEEYVRRQL